MQLEQAVIEYLKKLNPLSLHAIIYGLMVEGKISYHELMDMHIQNLERMKKGETEAYFRLQAQVVNLWCDHKKNIPKNVQSIMQLLKDEGRVNLTQEKIDKYYKEK